MLRRPTSGETFDRANWQAGERKEEPYRGPDRELVRVCESLPGFVKQGDYEYYSRATDIAITIDRDGGWYIGSEKDEASGTGGAALRAAVLKMSGSQMSDGEDVQFSDPVAELRSRHPVQFADGVKFQDAKNPLNGMNSSDFNRLREAYYVIGDHVDDLIHTTASVADRSPLLAEAAKAAKELAAAYRKLGLGKFV